MSLKNIPLKDTYWSGNDDLINEFYIPCLQNSISYDRAVGYFSSSILKYISNGLYQFIMNGGKIRLICSAELSHRDIELIKKGYDNSEDIFESKFSKEIDDLVSDSELANVKNLAWLIKNERLDIKICIKSENKISTLFHEKFGIFKDTSGDIVSYMGSINESPMGWLYNEESFEVSYTWEPALKPRVMQKVERFERLWNNLAEGVDTYSFPDALRKKIVKIAPSKPVDEIRYTVKKPKIEFIPRKCQKEAFEKYSESYSCFFQMATGSGKTKASLYSFKNTPKWRFLLILVPNLELVEQWEKDVRLFFPDAYILKCSSGYNWKEKLLDIIEAKIPYKSIAISTYDSAISRFALDKFMKINPNIFGIICDEAHNLGSPERQKLMRLPARFRIGLSATPVRNFDIEGTERILEYFNNNIYKFTIKDAIDEEYLVEYEYYVYPYDLTSDEWDLYLELSKKINKCNILLNSQDDTNKNKGKIEKKLKNLYIKRAEIFKTSKNKKKEFINIVKNITNDNRLLVYCDSKNHLKEYANLLDSLGLDYYTYMGDMSKKDRAVVLGNFEMGVKKILLAIKCLDEGIDIPICDSAVFVSSSSSEREFIQRRGRVLRKYPGKNRAYIYDFFTIPPYDKYDNYEVKIAKELVEKEYRRINIISNDAINGISVKNQLDEVLDKYNLNPYRI